MCEDATWKTIPAASLPAFVKSGSTAAKGAVPAPPTTAGTTKFLCEDATWKTIPAASLPFTNGIGTNTTIENYTSGGTYFSGRYIIMGKLQICVIGHAGGNHASPTTFPKSFKYAPIVYDLSGQATITKVTTTNFEYTQTNWAWGNLFFAIGEAN